MKSNAPNPGSVFAKNPVLDRSKFNRKFLLRLFASPYSLAPFLAGWTDLLALWTFDVKSGPAVFVGIACILASLGIFLTRLALGKQELGKKVMEDMQKEAEQSREKALDDLDRKLVADGDPRTEKSLRDLRVLARSFQQSGWSASFESSAVFDILSGVEQLFRQSVAALEKSLQLWYIASQMASARARRPIIEERERIIADVGKSTEQLGRILAGVQTLGAGGTEEESRLAGIREELDQSLEVAKNVARRMRSLDRELDGKYDDGAVK